MIDTYYIEAAMSYDMHHGDLKQPTLVHNNPEDYGLTADDAKKARLRFLREEEHLAKKEQAFRESELFNHYCLYAEKQLLDAQDKLTKIQNQIKFVRNHKEGQKAISYDIATIKQIPIDTLVQVNAAGFFAVREERTPSCKWYKNDNTWVDFGNGSRKHDVIDLYCTLYKCDIRTALRELNKIL